MTIRRTWRSARSTGDDRHRAKAEAAKYAWRKHGNLTRDVGCRVFLYRSQFAPHDLLGCTAVIAWERTQLLTNSGAVLTEAVRKGAGIALLPTYCSVFEADLVPIETDVRFETPFWLCHNQDNPSKRAVQTAAQFLRHIFDRKAMPWFADQYLAPAKFPKVTPDGVMRNCFKPEFKDPLTNSGLRMAERIAPSP